MMSDRISTGKESRVEALALSIAGRRLESGGDAGLALRYQGK